MTVIYTVKFTNDVSTECNYNFLINLHYQSSCVIIMCIRIEGGLGWHNDKIGLNRIIIWLINEEDWLIFK